MGSPGRGERWSLKKEAGPSRVALIDQNQKVLMMSPGEIRSRDEEVVDREKSDFSNTSHSGKH